jgi:hypothetical protein
MRLTVLQVPDCPGAELLVRRLADLLDHARVDRQVVTGTGQAAAVGMTGSPTLLVDGVDLFVTPGTPPSLSCRLYRDEHDHLGNAPSTAQLRAALAAAEAAGG